MRIALGLTLLLSIILQSCNKPPKACIEVDKNSVAIGEVITFNAACSKKALSYIWTIEGPVGASENSIQWSDETFTRAFSTSGEYVVKLTAYKKFSWLGESASASTNVSVN